LLAAGTAALLLKEFPRVPDMNALQGTWSGQEIGASGPATMSIFRDALAFRGADPAEWYKGNFTLRVDTFPKQLYIVITDCSEPQFIGKTAHAIYKLEGDTFTVTGNEPGERSFPASFDAATSREFVLKKKPVTTMALFVANTLPDAPNNVTSAPLPSLSTRSIPGWGNVIDPDGDCTLTFADEKLTVQLPGSDHAWMPEAHRTNAPRVLQEVTGPFDMQVKVTQHFAAGAKTIVAGRNPYQDAGLLVWMDDGNNLKLAAAQISRDGRTARYFNLEFRHDGQTGEIPLPREATSLLHAAAYYLRLQIHNDKTTASVSGDGEKWFSTSLPGSGIPQKVQAGLIAENNTTSPMSIVFENFSVKPQ
jgi:uncharacterized protein (TIGR03067 family)